MPPPAAKRSSRIVIPEQPNWRQRLGALLVYVLVLLISATLRIRWIDRCGLPEGKPRGTAIYCLWHNRLALSMLTWHGYVAKHCPGAGLAAMISASRDGGMLIAVFERFGVLPVRGSSSRRGAQALRELTTTAKQGYNLAITPDGSRGPRYQARVGIIALAQLTGMPIIPFTYNAAWKITVNSWDRFQIPLPFSRCEMVFEKAFYVPRDASESDREKLRAQLEETLNGISKD